MCVHTLFASREKLYIMAVNEESRKSCLRSGGGTVKEALRTSPVVRAPPREDAETGGPRVLVP